MLDPRRQRAPRQTDPPRMSWPDPVPVLLWWTADYSDIREHIQRHKRLDRVEIWNIGCVRHGDYGSDQDCRDILRSERDALLAERAAQEIARADAEIRQRKAAEARHKRAIAKAKREAIRRAEMTEEWMTARAFWMTVDPSYAKEMYCEVLTLARAVVNAAGRDISLEAGRRFWLPLSVRAALGGSARSL
jgi:hypothetical protein